MRIPYVLIPVTEGFMARHAACQMATAFGRTADEARCNLGLAITEYVREFPDRRDSVLNVRELVVTVPKVHQT